MPIQKIPTEKDVPRIVEALADDARATRLEQKFQKEIELKLE